MTVRRVASQNRRTTAGCVDGCAVAAAIRELAAAVRATTPEPSADPTRCSPRKRSGRCCSWRPRTLKDQAAAGALPHHRFEKHYRFTRGHVAEIVRLSAALVKPPRRRVSVQDVAQDFRAAKAGGNKEMKE